ncbi:MAG TPA: hypothetical protein O0X47_07740, partial [Methanocorpusculum sp.]|nr:hypothetical protein [Methanocorpusculum sp.]
TQRNCRVNGSDEIVSIPLELESAGTQKLIALYFPLKKVLDSASGYLIHPHPANSILTLIFQ